MNNEKKPYNRAGILEEMASGDVKVIVSGLLTIVFSDEDWKWVQQLCIDYSKNENENIRGIALLCMGYISVFHAEVDNEPVKHILLEGLKDKSEFVRGHAYSALQDIDKANYNENWEPES